MLYFTSGYHVSANVSYGLRETTTIRVEWNLNIIDFQASVPQEQSVDLDREWGMGDLSYPSLHTTDIKKCPDDLVECQYTCISITILSYL